MGSVRSAMRGKDLIGFYPVLVMVHIVFINISLSYFFENETFMWFLLVVVLFMGAVGVDAANRNATV